MHFACLRTACTPLPLQRKRACGVANRLHGDDVVVTASQLALLTNVIDTYKKRLRHSEHTRTRTHTHTKGT